MLLPSTSKKKAWIPLDFLVGNEPFQAVIVTPSGKNTFLAPFLALAFPAMPSAFQQSSQFST
jgi:hypothetical protein